MQPRSCTSAVLAAAGSPGPYIPQFYQLPEFESIIRLPVPPADVSYFLVLAAL